MPGRSYDLVRQTPGGNPGDGSLNGALTVQANATSLTNKNILIAGTSETVLLSINSGNSLQIAAGAAFIGNFSMGGTIAGYDNTATVGKGLPPIYGKDKRTGLTAADASATTLYTTTAADQLYRLMGRILATAGTSPSATYTIKWTEGGATITKTLTISALDSDSDLSILIQPDNGTAITAQLTAISGTGTTVNVAATVEQMA